MYVLAPDNVVQSWPYPIKRLKEDNPGVSFPKVIYDQSAEAYEVLASYNVFPVRPSPVPAYNQQTEKIKETNPTLNGDVWVETWATIPLTPEEEQQKTAEIEYEVRKERDKLLKDSDWTQLPDTPVDPDAWTTYRQELRDLPQQPGFPWNVIWPIPPLT